ncbi:MAG: DUF4918 family protein [Melioribacteraceae bacterium]|nr:DUF4918 family protein [Melioribacteraceae bacterium]MCF8265350.1 DUF4918 family protein [Melioribacteraceae bacterium]MCF8430492.1 DUF4918 family protein [Melioribacteraceae bacterium]
MSNLFNNRAIKFFSEFESNVNFPEGVSVMNPYANRENLELVKRFFDKFYDDSNPRVFIVGINPGRFGGGLTGIGFTDPINLEEKCGINNNLEKRAELSSRFVYMVIDAFGGAEKFFSKFFLSALYPLALIKDGKNYNYYDSKEVYEAMKPEIIDSLKKQIEFGATKTAICFGKKNEKFLNEINSEINHFEKIITLDHPRYIMQYKLKKVDEYIAKYLEALQD